MQSLVIWLGEQRHAVPLASLRRLLPLAQWAAVTDAQPGLRGVLDLAGAPIAVFDLQALLGGAESAAQLRTRIALVDAPPAWGGRAPHHSAVADAVGLVLRTSGQLCRLRRAGDGQGPWVAELDGAHLPCLDPAAALVRHVSPPHHAEA